MYQLCNWLKLSSGHRYTKDWTRPFITDPSVQVLNHENRLGVDQRTSVARAFSYIKAEIFCHEMDHAEDFKFLALSISMDHGINDPNCLGGMWNPLAVRDDSPGFVLLR